MMITIHAHLANTLVQIHISLHLVDLINSELENTSFAVLCRGLLLCNIKGPLRLNSSLLDLDQNLEEQILLRSVKNMSPQGSNLS